MAFDYLDVWKVVAIVLAGGFGILGTVTATKTNRGALTRWGKISIAGIVITTSGGAIAQYFENRQDEAKSEKLQNQTLDIVKQTGATVANTSDTLKGLSRLFGQIGTHPKVVLYLDEPCPSVSWKEACDLKTTTGNYRSVPIKNITKDKSKLSPIEVRVVISPAKMGGPSAFYTLRVDPVAQPSSVAAGKMADNGHMYIKIIGEMRQDESTGLISFTDFPGSTLDVDSSSNIFYTASFETISIFNENGEEKQIGRENVAFPDETQWHGIKLNDHEVRGLGLKHKFPPRI
jgi:hypothetical protein